MISTPPAGADQDAESVFIVVVRSTAVRPARVPAERHDHALRLLRAIHHGCRGAEVYEGGVDYIDSRLDYDPKGDDMGHHDGHDVPFRRMPVTGVTFGRNGNGAHAHA